MLNYIPSQTGQAFHESDAALKMIWGPFGSGKSTVVAKDIQIYGLAQEPDEDRVRRTRWGIIRESYSQLSGTTRKSVLEVMPDNSGHITQAGSPLHGVFKFGPLPDYTYVQIEVELWAVGVLEDCLKFKSANWTGAWMNEADQLPDGTLEACLSRISRFPGGGRCTWAGVLMDFNRPPRGHYLWSLMEQSEMKLGGHKVADIAVFQQPPAAFKVEGPDGTTHYETNPDAENLTNLKDGVGYYALQIATHLNKGETDIIENRFCLMDVAVQSGKAVFPRFSRDKHVAKADIDPLPNTPITIGFDTSGIHPAATVWQFIQGKWCCLDELYGEEMGLTEFIEAAMLPLLQSKYPTCKATAACDPANPRGTTGLTPVQHLRNVGVMAYPAANTNVPATRINTVSAMLNKDQGGLLFSPKCRLSIDGMAGGYQYRKMAIHGTVEEMYSKTPVKNAASHLADSIQYFALYCQREEETSNLDPAIIDRMKRTRNQRRLVV